jgi:hypothetical protein
MARGWLTSGATVRGYRDWNDTAEIDASKVITLTDGTILTGCRPDLVNHADLLARNWCLIPLKPRSKVAAVRWEEYQRRFPTADEYAQWFTDGKGQSADLAGRQRHASGA